MGGANTNPQQQGQYETSQMMKRIEPINTPEMPYYGDAKPMAIPSNGKEPIRNMEYIKQEKALRESVRNLPEYTAVTPPPKPAATPIANEGPYMNSATADYPDVRGNTQNSQNRDTSGSDLKKGIEKKFASTPTPTPSATPSATPNAYNRETSNSLAAIEHGLGGYKISEDKEFQKYKEAHKNAPTLPERIAKTIAEEEAMKKRGLQAALKNEINLNK
jgi:hypothetical protein